MKKRLLTVLTAACAICGTFALAGCDSGTGTGSGGGETATVAGNTYTYESLSCDDMDAETLAQYHENYAGMVIIFSESNTFTLTMYEGATVQTGTYVQDGNAVTLSVMTLTANGNPITGFIPTDVDCTLDGTQFNMPNQIMEYTLNTVMRLQTAK
ncbi:MAG: hypothetical protein NC033_03610 [Clostridiales bacterium]|nr:hypothetical protein [Clostridiales bacterium]